MFFEKPSYKIYSRSSLSIFQSTHIRENVMKKIIYYKVFVIIFATLLCITGTASAFDIGETVYIRDGDAGHGGGYHYYYYKRASIEDIRGAKVRIYVTEMAWWYQTFFGGKPNGSTFSSHPNFGRDNEQYSIGNYYWVYKSDLTYSLPYPEMD
jgi:hypothetical protein